MNDKNYISQGQHYMMGQPSTVQPMMRQPSGFQPIMGQPSGSQPIMGQPSGSQPMMGQPSGFQPMMGQPSGFQPMMGQPSGFQPMMGQPSGSQPVMGQPSGSQPIMRQPSGFQPMMGQPSGSQPMMGQPSGSQPMMGQPSRSQPMMGQPSGSQPMMGQPSGSQPMMGQPSRSQPMMGQPSRSQPMMGQPSAMQPMMGQPSSLQPMMGHPSTVQPMMGQPLAMQPMMGQPSAMQHSMGQPSTVHPMMGQPSAMQHSMGQPSTVHPMMGQSPTVHPMMGQPSNVQPMMGQSSTVQPIMGQPSNVQLMIGQPSNVQPMMGQLSTVQPIMGQPSNVQLMTGQPSNVQPMMGQSIKSQIPSQNQNQIPATQFQTSSPSISSLKPNLGGVPNLSPEYQGISQVPTQQEKPSEKQEWFKVQKERLQASKIQDKVRNPVDDMFGKKIAVAQSPLHSAPQSKPQQTVSQDVLCTASSELSNCDLSEEVPGSPCEDSKPEKEEIIFNKILEQSMNLKLDTPPMKKKQQFKSDKALLKSKQTPTVYSSSNKAREWGGEANEFRGLFTNEDDFGEFSSAEVPGTSHTSGFPHVQSYVQNVSGSQSQDTPAEYKPDLVPSQTQNVYNPVAPVTGTSLMPSVNQNPIMSSQLLHPIQNVTAVHSVENTGIASGDPKGTFSIPGSWIHNMSALPRVYHEVYRMASVPGTAFLDTAVITKLFGSSDLPRPVLKEIWNEVNKAYRGKLLKEEMIKALALIALAQGGVTALTCESLLNLSNAPVPRLTAVNIPPDLPNQSNVALSLPQSLPAVYNASSMSTGVTPSSTTQDVKSLTDESSVLKCLEICETVIHSTLEVLCKANSQILGEITSSSEGREKLQGVGEIHKIAVRMGHSYTKYAEIQKKKMSIENDWAAILNVSEMIKQIMETSAVVSNPEGNTQPCGLCSDVPRYSPSVSDVMTFKGCSCHVSCVNFWNTFISVA